MLSPMKDRYSLSSGEALCAAMYGESGRIGWLFFVKKAEIIS